MCEGEFARAWGLDFLMQFVITVFFACASQKSYFFLSLDPKVTPFWVEGLGRRMKRDNERVQVQESLFPSNAVPHTPLIPRGPEQGVRCCFAASFSWLAGFV